MIRQNSGEIEISDRNKRKSSMMKLHENWVTRCKYTLPKSCCVQNCIQRRIRRRLESERDIRARVDLSWQPYPRAIYGSIHAKQNFRCMILPWLPSFLYNFFFAFQQFHGGEGIRVQSKQGKTTTFLVSMALLWHPGNLLRHPRKLVWHPGLTLVWLPRNLPWQPENAFESTIKTRKPWSGYKWSREDFFESFIILVRLRLEAFMANRKTVTQPQKATTASIEAFSSLVWINLSSWDQVGSIRPILSLRGP